MGSFFILSLAAAMLLHTHLAKLEMHLLIFGFFGGVRGRRMLGLLHTC
jgi:hypothetical protein